MEIRDNLRKSLLAEIYKPLLTSKQRNMLCLFLDSNISLSEIAEEFGVSRQAVNDIVKRTFRVLEDYESKLKLLEKFEKIKSDISDCSQLLDKNENKERIKEKLNSILEVL
jgi:uncharacterized protein